MSFDVNWDIDKYKEEHESDDHWQLRRNFMDRWRSSYPEARLVCLSRVFANIEFMGCRYPQEVMQEVARMSKEVNKNITYKNYTTNYNDFFEQSPVHDSRSKMPGYETIQGSVNTELGETNYIGSSNLGFQARNPLYDVIQTPVVEAQVLQTPYYECRDGNFMNQNCGSVADNSEGSFKFGDSQQSSSGYVQQFASSAGDNLYEDNTTANGLPLWHKKDPRNQVSAGIIKNTDISQDEMQPSSWQSRDPRIQQSTHRQKETDILQQESTQSANWQTRDPRFQLSALKELQISQQISQQGYTEPSNNNLHLNNPRTHIPVDSASNISQQNASQYINQLPNQTTGYTDGEHSTNQHQSIPTIHAQNSRDEVIIIAEDQHDKDTSQELYMHPGGLGNMSTANGPGLSSNHMAYGHSSSHLGYSQNNYHEDDYSTYPETYAERQRKKRSGKNNSDSEKKLSGATARRYAYWINVGKSHEEAMYLCPIHMKLIPEYKQLKKTMGTICQLKRLKGDIIPTFKKKKQPRPFKKIRMTNGETATVKKSRKVRRDGANNMKSLSTPDEFKTDKEYKRYKFWLSIGKTEREAREFCKTAPHLLPLGKELKAIARKNGHTITWMTWTVDQYLKEQINAKKLFISKMEAALNSRSEEAEKVNCEDPDIIEVISKQPDTIVISDDEDVVKSEPKETNEINIKEINVVKPKIDNEIQRKRFDWWIQQGKSEEEATLLSQTSMAISDALDCISNYKKTMNKEMQEKNRVFNTKKTYNQDNHTTMPMSIPNTVSIQDDNEKISQLYQEWLAFKATEEQPTTTQNTPITVPVISNLDMRHGSADSNTQHLGNNAATTDEFKIYIQEASGKISYDRALQIRDAIARCIIDDDEITMPTCGIMHGCFVVICADEQTRDCLDKQIPTLEPWEGARLVIIDKIPVKYNVYAHIFVSAFPESNIQPFTKDKEILTKLQTKNPDMECSKWRVLTNVTQIHKWGRLLTVCFDKNTNDKLRLVGYRLNWFIRPIKVKLKDKKQKKVDSGKPELLILEPPTDEVLKSKSSVIDEIATVMPQAEVRLVETPCNSAERTTKLTPSGVIDDYEAVSIEICDSPSPPTSVYSKHANPSNTFPSIQERAPSNYENDAAAKVEYLHYVEAEQASQPTYSESSNITSKLRNRKLVDSAGYWRTDAPLLLSGHMKAIKWSIENKGCFEADVDDTTRKYCYGEVKPFSGEDEEDSIEERVAAERQNRAFESFKQRPQRSVAERVQGYYQERVLDERNPIDAQDDRTIQDSYQEYARDDRFVHRQSSVSSRESRFDDRNAECSRRNRDMDRFQEYSREGFNEYERRDVLEDRVIRDYPQKKVIADSSREHFNSQSPDYVVEDEFVKRYAEFSRKARERDGRSQVHYQESFDKNERQDSSEDRIIQNSPQHTLTNQEYARDNRLLVRPSQQYFENNRFSDRRSPEYSDEDRLDQRNLDYQKRFDKQGASSGRDKFIQDAPPEKLGLNDRNRDSSRDGRYCDTRSPVYHSKGRFDNRDSERHSKNDSSFEQNERPGRYQEHSREDRVFDEQNKYSRHTNFNERDKYSWSDKSIDQRASREPRDSDYDEEYSEDDRDQTGGNTRSRFQNADELYRRTYSNTFKRSHSQSAGLGPVKLQLSYPDYRPKKKRSRRS